MRISRVNITMPDDLYRQAKRAGLSISRVAQAAVASELSRLAKIAELEAYLAELEAELGPTSDSERAAAAEWAERARADTRSAPGVTLVLDSGGITMLAMNRARLEVLRLRGEWPPLVPAVVLTEALTGDHRRDFRENRLLRMCDIRPTGEELARFAAVLRTAVGGPRTPSAVDAVVVALADEDGGAAVLTSDAPDLRALARRTVNTVRIGTG